MKKIILIMRMQIKSVFCRSEFNLKMQENYFFNNVLALKLQVLMQEVKKTSHFCKKSCKFA